MFTDTHCHVLSNCYLYPESIINNLSEYNIKRLVINGYDNSTNKDVLKLIENKNVYGSLGIHPDNISSNLTKSKELIEENITNSKIIALGEVGLDYYHNSSNKEEQIELLEYFLKLSEQTNKPLIIHCRDASSDLIDILKKHKTKGIIHCFSGSIETAKEYIKLGYKLGIGGVVTFKNSKLKETLKKIDIKNILLETDSPYLSPDPLRGLPNEPVNINIIAKTVADIYEIKLVRLSEILEENFNDIFDI